MSDTQKNKKPNVPNLRFPGFEGEWNVSSIGNEFELYSGNTPSRLDKNNFMGEINWITSGELKNHYIGDTKEKISENSAVINNLKLLPEGTFVIAIYGLEADGVRATGSITTKRSTISQACMAFIPKGKISNEFLYSWYKKHGNLIGIKYAQGTKQQNLSYDIIERLQIRYPSSQEQEKLNSFISLIDARISIQNKVIEDLKKLKTALEERLLNQCIGEQVRLGDILTEKVEKSRINNQYEVLSSTVSGIYSQREFFNKEIASADNTGYKVIHRDDVVLSPQNLWMGNINFNDCFEIGIVSPSYKVFSINAKYDKRYIAFLLKTRKTLWEFSLVSEQGASVVRRNLNIESFLEIAFHIPTTRQQIESGNMISSVFEKIRIEQRYLKTLIRQKHCLLNNLII